MPRVLPLAMGASKSKPEEPVKPERRHHKTLRYEQYVKELSDLSGKVTLVTGANEGLGYHVARAAASKGATVVLCCRTRAKAEETAKNIKEGGEVTGSLVVPEASLDLAKFREVRRFGEEIKQQFPKVDVLVNNAGGLYTTFLNAELPTFLNFIVRRLTKNISNCHTVPQR